MFLAGPLVLTDVLPVITVVVLSTAALYLVVGDILGSMSAVATIEVVIAGVG